MSLSALIHPKTPRQRAALTQTMRHIVQFLFVAFIV
jgi:hypothetical protein